MNPVKGRRTLIDRSVDIYDGQPNDPVSAAQSEILTALAPPASNGQVNGETSSGALDAQTTPSRSQQTNALSRVQDVATPRSSVAGSPVPEVTNTPHAAGTSTPAMGGQSSGGPPPL